MERFYPKFFNLVTNPHVNFRKISILLCHMFCCLVHSTSWRETSKQAKKNQVLKLQTQSFKILMEPCQPETESVSAIEDL